MQTMIYQNPPRIAAHSSIAGKKEQQGPLGGWFDIPMEDDLLGKPTWEQAESEMICRCALDCVKRGGLTPGQVELLTSGDLNAQLYASGFAARELGFPYLGLYGACSTFVEGLVLASALIDAGHVRNALCSASSHFCTAERQFRFPLELGTQRPPSASWTATAAGCALLVPKGSGVRVTAGTIGRVVDYAIKDANHMGAAMAPAVFDSIASHLADTGKCEGDFDRIVTGDLGYIGREILLELFSRNGIDMPEDKLVDCGASLYSQEQDAHAGGSGCGCVASVTCGVILKQMEAGEYGRVLLTGSGALLSPTSSQQGESIPGVAYTVSLEA